MKDVLTEFLKEQEKDRVKQELKDGLESYINDELLEEKVRVKNQELTFNVEKLETYTYWLEHELLTNKIIQLLKDMEVSEDDDGGVEVASETEDVRVLLKLLDRSQQTLEKVSTVFPNNKKKGTLFIEAEEKVLSESLERANLSKDSKQVLSKKMNYFAQQSANRKHAKKIREETINKRIDSAYEAQVSLFIATLEKLPDIDKEFIDALRWILYSDSQETAGKFKEVGTTYAPTPNYTPKEKDTN